MTAPADISVAQWQHDSGTTWRRVARIATWQDMSIESRWLQAGPWSMTLPYNAQTVKIDTNSLLTVDVAVDGWPRATLAIEQPQRSSDETTGRPVLLLTGTDATSILGDALCLPVPSATVQAGTLDQSAAAYYVASGQTETILHDLIIANDGQLSWPITVPASQGRGIAATLNQRMGNLLEVVTRKCSVANLGVRVGLVSASPTSTTAELTCEFITPTDRSQRVKLVQQTGSLRSWSQTDTIPTATRAIVAGGGKGAARIFRVVVDTDAESTWGRKRTIFVDARDLGTDTAQLDERGLEALAEQAAQSSFSLAATEATGMRYGEHFVLGDQVTIQILLGLQRVDRLNSVVLTASADSGVDLQLTPGNPDGASPYFRQSSLIKRIRDDVRGLQQEES